MHYTPFYCEENIWHLCRQISDSDVSAEVVFITNPAGYFPMWKQSAATDAGGAVFWDYHVVLVTDSEDVEVGHQRPFFSGCDEIARHHVRQSVLEKDRSRTERPRQLADQGALVWDLDCDWGAPLTMRTWWEASFPYESVLSEQLRPCFRVVEGREFLKCFSSTREHMLESDGKWKAQPPPWPPITTSGELRGEGQSAEEAHTLSRFLNLEDGFVGDILTSAEFRRRYLTERPDVGR